MVFQRKRDALTFFPWLLEVLIACGILLFEVILHAFWYILPFWRIQEWVFGKNKRKAGEDALDFDFIQMAISHGYKCEEHYVQTDDGYILGIHRVLPNETNGSSEQKVASSKRHKGVVFFQHGFMQNSEAWIARGPGKCLTYSLVDEGYDVWLGNNRGSKYSHKHVKYSPHDDKFWNFCIDNFAFSDLPAMLQYVLETTQNSTLSYVGFSQGTAQAFAAFSINPKLASKVNLFIALAPATRVNALKNPVVAAVATSRPKLIFLLFGKKAMLGETLFWRRVLSHQVYAWVIDFFLDFLFGWKAKNINASEKPSLYAYLYSYSSVKNLVHWFQITESQNFQTYDDNIKINHPSNYKSYVLPSYQPSRISCPMAIFYGGQDKVPEMSWLLKQMPEGTFIHKEENYEHLDFMWASNAPQVIDKKVIDLLHIHNSQSKNLKSEKVEVHSVRM